MDLQMFHTGLKDLHPHKAYFLPLLLQLLPLLLQLLHLLEVLLHQAMNMYGTQFIDNQ